MLAQVKGNSLSNIFNGTRDYFKYDIEIKPLVKHACYIMLQLYKLISVLLKMSIWLVLKDQVLIYCMYTV